MKKVIFFIVFIIFNVYPMEKDFEKIRLANLKIFKELAAERHPDDEKKQDDMVRELTQKWKESRNAYFASQYTLLNNLEE